MIDVYLFLINSNHREDIVTLFFFFQFDRTPCHNACDYGQELSKRCGFLPASFDAFLAIFFLQNVY